MIDSEWSSLRSRDSHTGVLRTQQSQSVVEGLQDSWRAIGTWEVYTGYILEREEVEF